MVQPVCGTVHFYCVLDALLQIKHNFRVIYHSGWHVLGDKLQSFASRPDETLGYDVPSCSGTSLQDVALSIVQSSTNFVVLLFLGTLYGLVIYHLKGEQFMTTATFKSIDENSTVRIELLIEHPGHLSTLSKLSTKAPTLYNAAARRKVAKKPPTSPSHK